MPRSRRDRARIVLPFLAAGAVACGSVRSVGGDAGEAPDGASSRTTEAGVPADTGEAGVPADTGATGGSPDGGAAADAVDAAAADLAAPPGRDAALDVTSPGPDAPPAPSPADLAAFGCPADPALLACYTFDDPANRLTDGSPHGNHGMINSARVTSGVRGSALSFVTGNEFAIVPASPSLRVEGSGYTFEAWVRPTQSPADARVDFIAARWTAANTGFLFGAYDAALDINSSGGTGRRATTKLSLQRWSHVAVVASGTGVVLYTQGVAEAAMAALSFVGNDEPLTIGNRNPASSPDPGAQTAFLGDIDVLRIYSRAKTPPEICADANRTWTGTSCVDRAFSAGPATGR
jgi:hypothetical protein